MYNIFKIISPLIALCLPVVFIACGNPTLKYSQTQPDQMVFTENMNYERQNFIAKDFPYPLEFVKEKSINGVTTPNIGFYENYLLLTTLNGYLSIIPVNNIGKNRKTRLSKGTIAAPTLYGDKLYIPMVAGAYGLQVYDIKTGQILWKLNGNYSNSSPIVMKNLVYHTNQQGIILCLNSESGDQIWQADLDDNIYTNLVYAKDYLIAVSQNGQIRIYDPFSGLLNLTNKLDDHVYAQPIAVNQLLYIISYEGRLYNLNLKSGKISLIKEYNMKSYTPLSSDGQLLLIPLSDGTLVCRDIQNNVDIWALQLKGPASCPVLITNSHVVIATSQKMLYIINKENGEIIQTLKTKERISAPPVINGSNIIFCYEYDKIALYGSAGEEMDVTDQE